MNVVLVGADNPLGSALAAHLAHWGRHKSVNLSASASRWRSERQAKKAVKKLNPDTVVDLRLAWQLASGEVPQPLDLDRSHWLVKASERSGIRYLLLSSDQVFTGQNARSLRETDPPDAHVAPGFQMLEAEKRALEASSMAVVLRTGPLFSSGDRNFLTRMIQRMAADREAVFDDQNVFCPVFSEDAGRVVSAMLDQLSTGAPATGVFHYCSGDRTTEYGFAEVVLAAASQYADCGDVRLSPLENDETAVREHRVLDCSRLRDAFAIKQEPWRLFVNAVVKQYFSDETSRNA